MSNRLRFEQIRKESGTSFRYDWSVQHHGEEISLHFHPEIEICWIIKGAGYRMMGDFLEPFQEGEVVFVPSDLPHCWLYDPESCVPDGNRECMVVQFDPSLLHTGLSFFPEWGHTAHQLLAIQQGMKITGEAGEQIQDLLKEMKGQEAGERMLGLIRLLTLAGSPANRTPIGIQNAGFNDITKNMRRTHQVFKYVIEHYKEKISLSEIASAIHMSQTAFCSFFKRETGKTFTAFVNEYRLEAVCTRLKNVPEKEINEIAWQCGFTDIPYFNRYFKKMKHLTPSQWRAR